GAPVAIPDKERAAVAAGAEICAAVAVLGAGDGAPGAALSVGVGVATGQAFVGNVEAGDRMIWTAIGDTVNLAARLQALSREAAAAMVVDSRTWWRLKVEERNRFARRPEEKIRGRRQLEDVYVIPLASSAGAAGPARLRGVAD